MARQEALMQKARVKRVWGILLFFRDFQEINYPKKRTTEAQSTQRENFCISFGTFFYLEVSYIDWFYCVHLLSSFMIDP
ncbi:MAG: hypothetical protein HEQ20_20480 [Aphanizomenon flos-aquae KM1D3_PB]|nr:hypothetical protein OA07_04960 [Aphanizomenon flos-aquae 2012/KM1/D3]QSV72685.1 MAG: hypothetical protein HEQ20_20480 [Aphanizomenon flos-aquae KM1D3_PB]